MNEQLRKKIIRNNYRLKKAKFNKIKGFKEECKKLDDVRIPKKTTYKIWDIVTVVFLAVLANCNDWEEIAQFAKLEKEWLRNFLQLTGGIPSAKTYERVISSIKHEQLEHMMIYFVRNVHRRFTLDVDILSFDGKVDTSSGRDTTDYSEEVKQLNVLNVYSKNEDMCIYSEMIDDKTNEIPTVENVINKIDIEGSIATWDALNTQKSNVLAVIENKADYVVALKGNHETFHEEVKLYFDEDMLNIMRSGAKGVYLTHNEKSHSLISKYEYFQTEDIKWFEDKDEWMGLKSIGVVVKTTIKNGKENIEKRYYISSLLNDILTFSNVIRLHWGVENKLHWQLDYTFKCDNNTTIDKKALFNLQIIKKGCLALLNRVKPIYGTSLKLIRQRLALDFDKEMELIFNSFK